MKKALGFLSLLALVFCFALPAQADDEKLGHGMPAGTIIVPAGLNGKEVQRGIMEAGAEEDFIVKARDDEKVVLVREDGSWTAVLTFVYDTNEIQIYSKSLRSGKPELPESWIKTLKKVIGRKLNTTAVMK